MGQAQRRREVMFRATDLSGKSGLEIGPLTDPIALKPQCDVVYADHVSRDALVARYRDDPNVDIERIVGIDRSLDGLSIGQAFEADRFDYMVASHVAEHIPDLIGWLRDARKILKPGGVLYLVLPDRRFSFDCRRSDTTLPDLLDAYIRRVDRPQVRQILDCALGVTHSDAMKIYSGEATADELPLVHTVATAFAIARETYEDRSYRDIHCSVFTPKSFADLMRTLVEHGLIELSCHDFIDTRLENNFEFFVSLQKSTDQGGAIDSWETMARRALEPIQGAKAGPGPAGPVGLIAGTADTALRAENEKLRRLLVDALLAG